MWFQHLMLLPPVAAGCRRLLPVLPPSCLLGWLAPEKEVAGFIRMASLAVVKLTWRHLATMLVADRDPTPGP
jgi:hypothetical protein